LFAVSSCLFYDLIAELAEHYSAVRELVELGGWDCEGEGIGWVGA